jgi:hypothetical protein
MIFALLSISFITLSFLLLAWDEADTWKFAACCLMLALGLSMYTTSVHDKAYVKGYESSVCHMWYELRGVGRATADEIPEFCDD